MNFVTSLCCVEVTRNPDPVYQPSLLPQRDEHSPITSSTNKMTTPQPQPQQAGPPSSPGQPTYPFGNATFIIRGRGDPTPEGIIVEVGWEWKHPTTPFQPINLKARWCTEFGFNLADGPIQWEQAKQVTDSAVNSDESNTSLSRYQGSFESFDNEVSEASDEGRVVTHPTNISGQQSGAILRVMRIPTVFKANPRLEGRKAPTLQVGDLVELIYPDFVGEKDGWAIKKLSSGWIEIVPFDTFLPIGVREMCGCPGQKCRCVYEDFEKSRAFSGL
jgi:hypothetical protein